jgi:hypothetical protein
VAIEEKKFVEKRKVKCRITTREIRKWKRRRKEKVCCREADLEGAVHAPRHTKSYRRWCSHLCPSILLMRIGLWFIIQYCEVI